MSNTTWKTDDDTLARIALSWFNTEIDETTRSLLTERGPRAALTHYESTLDETQRSRLAQAVDAIVLWTIRLGQLPITPAHADWPTQVDSLGTAAPLVLWTRGDTSLLVSSPITAITGTRRPSASATFISTHLATALHQLEHTVASTGEYGCPGEAVRAVLASGGSPIVVLDCGIEQGSPLGHYELFQRVAKKGLLVSAYPPQTGPTQERQDDRRTLLAAIAGAVTVVEADEVNASLITARAAVQLGRAVGAFPGIALEPIKYDINGGNHALIRNGTATLVASVSDVQQLH